MAQVLKNSYSQPSANTDTLIYTCPSATATVISNINICNRNSTSVTFQVFRKVLGSTPSVYKYADVVLAGNDTFNRVSGDVLIATDQLYVRASSTLVDFEISYVETS